MSAGTSALDPFDEYHYQPLPTLSSSRKRIDGPRLHHHLTVDLPQEFIIRAGASDRDIQSDIRLFTRAAFGCLLLLYLGTDDFLFAEIKGDVLVPQNETTTSTSHEELEGFTQLLRFFRVRVPLLNAITPSGSPSTQKGGAGGFPHEAEQQNRNTFSWLTLTDHLRSAVSTSNHNPSPDIPI